MYSSNFIVRDYTQSTTIQNTNTETLQAPTMTWEQFILFNVEIERLYSLSRSLTTENNNLKQQINQQNNHSLQAEVDRLRAENQSLRASSQNTTELESRIKFLTSENQRLSSHNQERESLSVVFTDKLKEIESLRHKIVELERSSVSGNANELHMKIAHLTSENANFNTALVERLKIMEHLEAKYIAMEDLYLRFEEYNMRTDNVPRKPLINLHSVPKEAEKVEYSTPLHTSQTSHSSYNTHYTHYTTPNVRPEAVKSSTPLISPHTAYNASGHYTPHYETPKSAGINHSGIFNGSSPIQYGYSYSAQAVRYA